MKYLRRFLPLFLLISLLTVPVLAHDVPDLSRTGSITVRMHKNETPVPGGTLTAYRVGQIQQNDGNYVFVLTEAFAASGLSLEDPEAQALAAYAAQNGPTGTAQTVSAEGIAKFTQLELGLYLMIQTEPAPGYSPVAPFLVSLPYTREGVYVYDVDAVPKLELEPVPTEPIKPLEPTLPQTGQLNWPVPVLAVAGLTLLVLGIVLYGKGKKCEKDSV